MAGYDDREFDERDERGDGPERFDRGQAANQVKGPAIGLIVTGILGILVQVLGLVFVLAFADGLTQMIEKEAEKPTTTQEQRKQFEQFTQQIADARSPMNMALTGLAILVGVVVVVGALKMKRLESWGFSLAVTILAMPPMVSPCCCIGLPIGIWALVVLLKPEVKSAFR